MKALKIIGGIIGTIGLAIGVFYFGWLSPPSAQAVCDNVSRIVKAESGADLPATEAASCVRRASTPPEFGRAVWVKQLKCMRDAKSSKEVDACSRRRL